MLANASWLFKLKLSNSRPCFFQLDKIGITIKFGEIISLPNPFDYLFKETSLSENDKVTYCRYMLADISKSF